MSDAVPLSYQHGTVGDALARGVGPESNRAGFLEQTLQCSPGREVEAAEMLHLEPVGNGWSHQQIADFLRGIRTIRVAPKPLELAPIELRQVLKLHFYRLRPMI